MADTSLSPLEFDRSPAYLQWRLDRIARRKGLRIGNLTSFRDEVLALLGRGPEGPALAQCLEGIREDFETVQSRRLEADPARYDLAVKRLMHLARQSSLDLPGPVPRFLLKSLPSYAATGNPRPQDARAERLAYYDQYVSEHHATVHQALPVSYDAAATACLSHIWDALPETQPSRLQVDRFWQFQALDFARSTPGGQARIRDVAALLQPMAPDEDIAPKETLERALQLAAERGCAETAQQIVEMEIPCGLMLFGTEAMRLNGDFGELSNFVGKIEATLGRSVRLISSARDRMSLRIPSASLLDALLETVLPERCPCFHFVDGAISTEEFNDLHAQWKIPVGLARQAIYLKDFGVKVHPFFYTFHDYFHGYMATYLPASVVATSVELYRLASRLPADSPFLRHHLNALLDLDPGISEDRSMLRFFKKSLNPLNKVMGDLERLENSSRLGIVSELRAGIRFLENYLQMLRENPAEHPETAAHFREIETDLGLRLHAFRNELEAQLSAGGLEAIPETMPA